MPILEQTFTIDMKKILFFLSFVISLGALAQDVKVGDNCLWIPVGKVNDPLGKVRYGFSLDVLASQDLSLSSLVEKPNTQDPNETVVTCKAKSEEGDVTFYARVSGGFVQLFGYYSSEGRNKRMYYTGNESDPASFFFLKLKDMFTNNNIFSPASVRYVNKNDPWSN